MKDNIIQRENYLDVAKGIALYLMVLGHLVHSGGLASTWIYSFHMMLFFFISGYSFNPAKYKSYGLIEYFDKKVKSRLIPFAIISTIGLIACLIIPAWRESAHNIAYSVLYLAQPSAIQVTQIWFLACLFWTENLFFYFYKMIFSKVHIETIIFITLLISIIGFNMNTVTFFHYPRMPWKIDSSITALVFYIVGFYTKDLGLLNKLLKHKFISALLMIPFGLLGLYIAKYKNGFVDICLCQYNNYFYFYMAAFCGILCILIFSKLIENIKILQYYGKNTLWMFATHSFFISFSVYILNVITQKQYVRRVNIPFSYCLIISIIVYLALSVIPFAVNYCKRIDRS